MKTKFIQYLSIILLFPGCMFYSFKGSLPAHIHSISLSPVINESTEYLVAEMLNDELNRLMAKENVLDIVRTDLSDSQLEILITSVTDRPYTVSLSDKLGMEEVDEWRLTISTKVSWYDIKKNELLLEKNMSSWGIYAPGLDISSDNLDNDGDNLIDSEDSDEVGSARESAMKISIQRLTEDIVSEITNIW